MTENLPLLSICIPTYNRAPYLKRLLDGLLLQIKKLNGVVNLYVSDNGSTDDTEELCSNYIVSGFQLIYIRNSENKGVSANIIQAFLLGIGEYVWVLGDDDFIYDNALELIVTVLLKQPLSILYLSYENFVKGVSINKKVQHFDCRLTFSAEDFSKKTGIYLTFISALIVNRKELLQKNQNFYPNFYAQTYLPQLSWVFPLLVSGKRFAKTKEKVFAAERMNTGGYKLYTVFGQQLMTFINTFLLAEPKVASNIAYSSMWFLLCRPKKTLKKFETENPLLVMNETFRSLPLYKYCFRFIFRSVYHLPYSHFIFYSLYKIQKLLWRRV